MVAPAFSYQISAERMETPDKNRSGGTNEMHITGPRRPGFYYFCGRIRRGGRRGPFRRKRTPTANGFSAAVPGGRHRQRRVRQKQGGKNNKLRFRNGSHFVRMAYLRRTSTIIARQAHRHILRQYAICRVDNKNGFKALESSREAHSSTDIATTGLQGITACHIAYCRNY